MLSLAILAVILVVAVGILQAAIHETNRQDISTRATFLAQEKLEELSVQKILSGGQGQFPAPFEDYRWTVESKSDADSSGLELVRVRVQGPGGAEGLLQAQLHQRRVLWFTRMENGRSQLMSVNEDGSDLQLRSRGPGRDSQPSISSDGETVVFVSDRGGSRGLYQMSLSTEDEPQVVMGAPAGASEPGLAPDGEGLLCTAVENGYAQVFRVDAAGNAHNLSQSQAHEGSPAWAPDGRSFVCLSNGDHGYELILRNSDGSGRRTLHQEEGWLGSPSFSPDGTGVVFMANRDGNPELYRVEIQGHAVTRLTAHPGYDTEPRYSPDGNKLAFSSDRSGRFRIYMTNGDGSGTIPITVRHTTLEGNVDREPTWAPARESSPSP